MLGENHSMEYENPLLTIGLPVYNGERFLKTTIESILNQSFKDFELIIVDNASEDMTEEICKEYAAKDKRIHYHRNPDNIGAAPNYNHAFKLSKGKYFKWAAHDDICAPEFLEKCIEVLEKDSDVVLCHSIAKVVDENGNLLNKKDDLYVKYTNDNIKLKSDSQKPHERFFDLAYIQHSCYQIFGVIRSSILKKTPLIDNYAGADRLLLARLSLFGKFHQIPEDLFFLRRHSEQSININALSIHLYTIWHDTSKKGKIIFPRWRRFHEHIIAINESPLNWPQKLSCYLVIAKILKLYWRGIINDLVIVSIQIIDKLYYILKGRINSNFYPKGDLIFNRIPRLTMNNFNQSHPTGD
ncbi:glycosyltransferase family 2 protein [Calothrix rhizosoleniae]|uniref:glycosyltransferase family 2 protein n=1 Tax=Calothrix rhizosoleniae TaxID=888997 RepID=UPI00190E8DE1|nr:glycosyltransferase [Calothrix rhizosoleniae]